jgi:hypothetical protein
MYGIQGIRLCVPGRGKPAFILMYKKPPVKSIGGVKLPAGLRPGLAIRPGRAEELVDRAYQLLDIKRFP